MSPAILPMDHHAISARCPRRVLWCESSPTLGDDVHELLDGDCVESLEVIWSAGTFAMNSAVDVEHALASFDRSFSELVSSCESHGSTRVHLVSSAGALGCPISNQRFAVLDSPYREIKAGEELRACAAHSSVRVHRVTSVFGTPGPTGRSGLVGALLANALRAQETPLFARTVTMRNYIHADDVAEALVRATESQDTGSTLLAAGRSHPMHEVVATARGVLRRSIPVSYRTPMNDHDMVFDPRAVSALVPQRPLAAGMRMVYDSLISA